MPHTTGKPWTPDEVLTVRKLREEGWTRRQIADHFDVSLDSISHVIKCYLTRMPANPQEPTGPPMVQRHADETLCQELSGRGYRIEKIVPEKTDRRVRIDPKMFEGEKKKFGVISCTHLGSKFQQLTHLRAFYAYAQDQGVKVIFHAGDMIDGDNVYRGHQYERFLHGIKAQRDYTIEHYPRMENGGKTYVIDGNHDYSFWQYAGESVLEGVAKAREDIDYIGSFGAYPRILGLNIYLQHGASKVAYARSYKMQKNIEQMAPDKKPDIYLLGHFHSSCVLLEYRNVTAIQLPSFQAQTPYAVRNGWPAEIGGFILTITQNERERKNGTSKIHIEFVPFYIPVEEDYR